MRNEEKESCAEVMYPLGTYFCRAA